MYGTAFPMHLPTQDASTSPQLQQQKSGQLGSWQPQTTCPPSPFDLMLRQESTSGMRSAASPFDFPMVHSGAAPAASMPSLGQGGSGLMGQGPMMSIGRSAVSPFDIPNGRVQQLLANSNINSSLGRPPPSPFDLPPSGRVPGRSPFDMALGGCGPNDCLSLAHEKWTTTSSGSGGRGGLPLFDARSMERSLGSEGSPGNSMLGEGGEDLVGVPQTGLEKHQQLFVRYSGLSEAHAMPEWRGKDSFAAEAASFGEIDLRARAENMPAALSMRIVSAPASFALPMVQRKVFKPPFTLRVEIQYRQPLSLPVSVEVHAINDAAHSKIATWLPEADKMHAELEGNRISRTLNVSGGMGYGNGIGLDLAGKQSTAEHLHLEDFKFSDLKWAKSSRMSKRWLVFSLRVKDDVVYLLYQLPTVVISRRTDQYSKAHEILTGVSANAAKRPRTAPHFPPQAASVPPPAAAEASLDRPSRLAHASSAPEGVHPPPIFPVLSSDMYLLL
ncbi:hypothetical protein COCOBI_06-1240 [Coccomyxa sp. Obi]|nr:hypothetical protein COCOBI_06-1240 [Coccomyxa sp. Obi]